MRTERTDRSGLARIEDVRKRCLAAVDHDRMRSLWRQVCFLYGRRQEGGQATGSEWPVYADLRTERHRVGISRDTLNALYLSLSRTMSIDPVPKYRNLDPVSAEIRQQFWLARYRGYGQPDSGFDAEVERCFLDFDGLGLGCLEVVVGTGTDGQDKTDVRHVSPFDALWCPSVRDPRMSPWAATRRFYSLDEAEAEFGDDVRKTFGGDLRRVAGQWREPGQRSDYLSVEVVTYRDTGVGLDGPTMVRFVGGLGSKFAFREAYPLDCLNTVFWVNVLMPGSKYPWGRVARSMATQQAKNDLQAKFRQASKVGPVRFVDTSVVDPEDLAKIDAGEIANVKVEAMDKPPFAMAPGAEVTVSDMRLYEMLTRELTDEQQQSETDKGLVTSEQRTLGEISQVQTATAQNRAHLTEQTARGMLNLVRTFEKVAREYDRSAVVLDVRGTTFMVNDPDDPRTSCETIYAMPADAVLDAEALTTDDDRAKKAAQLQDLQAVGPFIGTAVDPAWAAKKTLEAIGMKDEPDALMPTGPGQAVLAPGQGAPVAQ